MKRRREVIGIAGIAAVHETVEARVAGIRLEVMDGQRPVILQPADHAVILEHARCRADGAGDGHGAARPHDHAAQAAAFHDPGRDQHPLGRRALQPHLEALYAWLGAEPLGLRSRPIKIDSGTGRRHLDLDGDQRAVAVKHG